MRTRALGTSLSILHYVSDLCSYSCCCWDWPFWKVCGVVNVLMLVCKRLLVSCSRAGCASSCSRRALTSSSCLRSLQSPLLRYTRIKSCCLLELCLARGLEHFQERKTKLCFNKGEGNVGTDLYEVTELGQKVCVLFILTSFLGTSGNTFSFVILI